MRKTQSAIVMFLTLSCCLFTTGCAATASTERIDKLVVDLASEKYRVREAADRQLRNMLQSNIKLLRAIVPRLLNHLDATTDPEVTTRLERMLGPAMLAIEHGGVETLYLSALDLYRQLLYEEAADKLRLAVQLDPDYKKAKKLLYEVLWILGEKEEQTERQKQAICAAVQELSRLYNSGRKFMEENRYGLARERFERCVEIIRWFPYYLHSDERYTDAIEECDRKIAAGR